MKRVLTAAVLVPAALAAIFYLSGWGFLLFAFVLVEMAAVEFARLTSRLIGNRVAWAVPLLVPIAVPLLLPDVLDGALPPGGAALALGFLASAVVGAITMWSRMSLEQTVMATGVLSFGVLYFAVPVAALVHLHTIDPWLVILVFAIVAVGDTAAYYIGTAWGRHRLAPVVSPKKSWEGAVASLIAATAAAAVWSQWRLGSVDAGLLAIAAVTSIAAQVGDLVESTFKRRVGVKDSSALLPGHGGMLDRLDALLFALPTLLLGLVVRGWL